MDNDYSFSVASMEIIVALAAAFIAGALLCYILRLLIRILTFPFRKRTDDVDSTDTYQAVSAPAANMGMGTTATAETDNANAGGFQAAFPDRPVIERAPLPEPSIPQPAPELAPPSEPARTPPRINTEGGAFEADINTLLRGGNPEDNSAIVLPESSSSSFESRARESLSSAAASPRLAEVLEMPADGHIDDLKKLEGIGPRIEGLLNQYGIKSYARLATMDRDHLRDILDAGGSEFKMHEPKSWPYQAELAAKENWDRLREYQEFLMEGKDR